ncbi:Nuclear pore complex protein, partial [Toxocara canis]
SFAAPLQRSAQQQRSYMSYRPASTLGSSPYSYFSPADDEPGSSLSPYKAHTSCRHDALYVYFSRMVSNLWTSPLCYKLSETQISNVFSSDELEWLVAQLRALRKCIDEFDLIGSAHEAYQSLISRRDTSTKSGASEQADSKVLAFQEERRSLHHLCELLSLSCEVLSLWKIVSTHQFHVVTAQLSNSVKDQLCSNHFSAVVVGGHHLCADLITCLMRYYLHDNASTSAICGQLRSSCPTLFSEEDATAIKATEMVEEARSMEPSPARTELLAGAIRMLKASVHKLNLPVVCQLLYVVECMEGIVELALARAERDDPRMLAIAAYKNRSTSSDPLTREALAKRKEAYKCITDALDLLMAEARTKSGIALQSAVVSRDLIVNLVLRSKDELANVTVFKWLLDNDLSNTVVEAGSESPYVESFLRTLVEEGGSSAYLDLLWRFYERNGNFAKAARLLYTLARRDTSAFDLRRRIAYLSQALMCARAAADQLGDECESRKFLLGVQAELDVAEIQLATENAILAKKHLAGKAELIEKLESRLYSSQELLDLFAVPFDLFEIELAVCHCADAYDKKVIETLCSRIVEQELEECRGQSCDVRVERLRTRIAALYTRYSLQPKYFPIETVLCEVLTHGLSNGLPPSSLQTVGSSLPVPFQKLLDAITLCQKRDPFWRNNERAMTYLMECAVHVFDRFAAQASKMPIKQRKTVACRCLDVIASFLLQLSSSGFAAGDALSQLADRFHTFQNIFENI